MIDLHYWPTPNGHKITLLLEELVDAGHALAYRIKPVDIGAGENRGTSVTYANVVDHLQVVGVWSGAAMTLELPLADVAPEGTAGLAVIVQKKKDGLPGPIVGATRLALESSS